MKIIKIYTPMGFYKVGYEYVTRIEQLPHEGIAYRFFVYKEGDKFNKGKIIEVRSPQVEITWDEE